MSKPGTKPEDKTEQERAIEATAPVETAPEDKISPQEYVAAGTREAAKAEPSDALTTLAKAGDVNAQRELGRLRGDVEALTAKGWVLGAPAPQTKYLDSDGVTVTDTPQFTGGYGTVLVNKGEVITQRHIDQIAGA